MCIASQVMLLASLHTSPIRSSKSAFLKHSALDDASCILELHKAAARVRVVCAELQHSTASECLSLPSRWQSGANITVCMASGVLLLPIKAVSKWVQREQHSDNVQHVPC